MKTLVTLGLSFLRTHWLTLLLLTAAGVVGMNLGKAIEAQGWKTRLQEAQSENNRLNQQLTTIADKRRREAEARASAMAQALSRIAELQKERDRLTSELQAKKSELEQRKQELKKAISDAVKRDVGFTGIGPRGLCLYNSALGYACDQYLPAAAGGTAGRVGETTGSGAGLSPAGLLNHSSEYGAWCQRLESQLIKLRQWYDREEQ